LSKGRESSDEAVKVSTDDLRGDAKVERIAAPPTTGPAEVAAVAAASQRPAVKEDPYSPARDREKQRTRLATAIVGGALLAAVGAGVSASLDGSATHEILGEIFTPLLGLAGAVVGFYFGGKDSTV
jgi:hypothetical protein